MVLDVLLGGFLGVIGCVMKMALGGVCVMSSGLVIAVFVVTRRFAMMASCVFVMFCCPSVVLGGLLGHGVLLKVCGLRGEDCSSMRYGDFSNV